MTLKPFVIADAGFRLIGAESPRKLDCPRGAVSSDPQLSRTVVDIPYGCEVILTAVQCRDETAGRRHHGIRLGLGDDVATRRRRSTRSADSVRDCASFPRTARRTSCSNMPSSAAVGRGLEVLIAGAGGAAHLPGMTAAKTRLARARRADQVARAQRRRLAAVDRPDAAPAFRSARSRSARPARSMRRCSRPRSSRTSIHAIAAAADSYRAAQTAQVLDSPTRAKRRDYLARSAPEIPSHDSSARRHHRCRPARPHDWRCRLSARHPTCRFVDTAADAPGGQVAPHPPGRARRPRRARGARRDVDVVDASRSRTSRSTRSSGSTRSRRSTRRRPTVPSHRTGSPRKRLFARSAIPTRRSCRSRRAGPRRRRPTSRLAGRAQSQPLGYDGRGQRIVALGCTSSRQPGTTLGRVPAIAEGLGRLRARAVAGRRSRRRRQHALSIRSPRTRIATAFCAPTVAPYEDAALQGRPSPGSREIMTALRLSRRSDGRVLSHAAGGLGRQRDGAARAQLRPLDDRGRGNEPVRESPARRAGLAARQRRARAATRPCSICSGELPRARSRAGVPTALTLHDYGKSPATRAQARPLHARRRRPGPAARAARRPARRARRHRRSVTRSSNRLWLCIRLRSGFLRRPNRSPRCIANSSNSAEPPFRLTPDPQFLFASKQHARAKAYMESTIWLADGFVVITGDIGSGKTTLIESFPR